MKLSIITLTYNKLEYTKQFIESLYRYTKDFELIIVDNGSTDGTVDFIKSLDKDNIKLIVNSKNLGFPKGNNQGLEIAEGEYIGFLNNDILLSPNWFEECEKVFLKEKVGFISPRHINPNFHKVNCNNYIKYFKKKFIFKTLYDKSFDECQFSCVITKNDVISNIGNFDETFTPAFFEDNDLKYRAIENGYDCFVSNLVCFFHYGSVTSRNLNYNYRKNMSYYYKKHRFAEYLSIYTEENQSHRFVTRYLESLPIYLLCKNHLFMQKIVRNIKRVFKS